MGDPRACRDRERMVPRSATLNAVFDPKSIAVIGASESKGSVGLALMENLGAFSRPVFAVNPNRASILGKPCYASVGDLPAPVDLAVIATPAITVPGIIEECARAGVRSAVVISAGFKELGVDGAKLEKEMLERAGGKLRIIGPNCLGVMNPRNGLNATFANRSALPGRIAFLSQSGALCTSVLDWSAREKVGFSAFVSIGSMADVDWGDLIDHFGEDPETQSILLYMETVGDARAFLSAAREAALRKPIVVLKAGRTEAAKNAAISHTGSMAGSDDVLDAAFRRSGVLRVNDIRELFNMAEILAKQPHPQGPRLAVLTNAGGPGVLAADAFVQSGGPLADLSPETVRSLDAILPPHWSRNNPVDILGDAGPGRYLKAVEILRKDPHVDGLLVILSPQAMTSPTETAHELAALAKGDKPVLASWMGGDDVSEARSVLTAAGIPVMDYPDEAARAFRLMWQYTENLRSLYETPILPSSRLRKDQAGYQASLEIIAKAVVCGRRLLSEHESKRLLSAYGIPVAETRIAYDESEAVELAHRIGYPVVLKLSSDSLTHKTDVDGVKLDLMTPYAVRKAFADIRRSVNEKKGPDHFQGVTVQKMVKQKGLELILGSSIDPQFGPVILFGAGGTLTEVFKDTSLGLPPLNTTLARRLIERTRIFSALQGRRGQRPADLKALEELLVRFSQMVVDQRRITEIDINPLLVGAEGIVALDARVLLKAPGETRPGAAIRPYPVEYVSTFRLKDGTSLVLRPIRAEDEPLMVRFHHELSEETIRKRYFGAIGLEERTAHERLSKVCFNDYDREIALVAELPGMDSPSRIVGVARLIRLPGTSQGEISMVIPDEFQHRGLGTELMSKLKAIAKKEGLHALSADMLTDNVEMRRLCAKAGFEIEREALAGTVKAHAILNGGQR